MLEHSTIMIDSVTHIADVGAWPQQLPPTASIPLFVNLGTAGIPFSERSR